MIQIIFPFALTEFSQCNQLADNALIRYVNELHALDSRHQAAVSGWGDYGIRDSVAQETGEGMISIVDHCPYPELAESPLFRNLITHYKHFRW
ncbi:MAG: hypothetical protein J4400_01760 [Candidatus Aenigmarchaeota archaeon]|nr:hypothetical protein [Candidatus Aenigmarchaeota archaeon]